MWIRPFCLKLLLSPVWFLAYGISGRRRTGLGPSAPEQVLERSWWRSPGIGIMYQVEYRPGYDWERDYTAFNQTLMNEEGRMDFPGPFCNIGDFVALSERAHVDYHVFSVKWHDGICYFDTALTDWKTDVDYAAEFAELSRASGIPFLFYYSSIFDHNPRFDAIQPNQHSTMSYIGRERSGQYKAYLRGQYQEIMERYHPDGMWMDWYTPFEGSTVTTVSFFRQNHPDTVLAFNAANLIPPAWGQLHYTSGEAHKLDGQWLKIVKVNGRTLPIFESCWKWAAFNRRALKHPWELVTPGGKWWQDPHLRDDPLDLVRMAAIVMANGGRLCVGATPRMDGSIYPDQVRQLEIIGDWYSARQPLFRDGVPMDYGTEQPAGVSVDNEAFRIIASEHSGDTLVHVINMTGAPGPVSLSFSAKQWPDTTRALLEPDPRPLNLSRSPAGFSLTLTPDVVDPVDTILRLQ
jgi:hypothetical protein